MNYYPFHVGDYTVHTLHLTPMQDLAYRRMIDWYFTHEKPLPSDAKTVARLIRLNECLTDVEQVLNEFFNATETGYENKRIEEEISSYKLKKQQQSDAGKASAEARRNKRSTTVKRTLNQPEPEPNNKYTPPVSPSLLADYLKVRKAKKAGELTETAFNGIVKEAAKVGLSAEQALEICCRRGWVGFNSSWIDESDRPKLKAVVL